MARKCILTGKRPNMANKVSHSHIKTRKQQRPNVHTRRLWLEDEQRWVKLKLSTRALRTIRKKGLARYASEVGLDLSRY